MRLLTATLIAAAICAATALPARAGDPVGAYAVSGHNPGGQGSYSGTVKVVKTGDTYRVTWTIGADTYVGTGIGDEKFLAVSYTSGGSSGLALYGDDGDNWQGVWTYQKGTKVGNETWTRQ